MDIRKFFDKAPAKAAGASSSSSAAAAGGGEKKGPLNNGRSNSSSSSKTTTVKPAVEKNDKNKRKLEEGEKKMSAREYFGQTDAPVSSSKGRPSEGMKG